MPKASLGDKLKLMFSPEKGKSICDYLYEEVLIPTAKNTVYTMGQIAWAKFMDMDISSIPNAATGRTAYSKIGTSNTRQPDSPSFLPATTQNHNDISWIPFDNAYEANKLIDFMESKIKGVTRECKVSDVYEYLRWNSDIQQTDFDIGWKTTVGVGVLKRNNYYYVQAPLAKRLS